MNICSFIKILIFNFFLKNILIINLAALNLSCGTHVVVAGGLSCSEACGILAPQPGIEPASPALQGGFLTTGPSGESPQFFL